MSGAGHVSRSVSRHARLVWLAGAVVVALGVASSDDRAEAYLLLDGGALDYIVPSSEAIRWSADVWGPGQTLVWEIEDGPDWELLPGGAEGFVPVVEEALAVWSAIETADISWRLAGVVEPATHGPRFPDARSRVSFENTNSHPLWGAELWSRRNRAAGTWEITECNIGLLQSLVELREDVEITDDDLRSYVVSLLVEELGRCLGLGSSSPLPGSQFLRTAPSGDDVGWRDTEIWGARPVMGQGWGRRLTSDDRIGASLLRPRDGWLARTGRLTGRLEADGDPASYVHVYALRLAGGRLRDPVGAFANADGEFLIEGLPPGDYVLWAHPLRGLWEHSLLVMAGATTDLKDAVVANPIRLEAGQIGREVRIPMRAGRE